ncbi:MAG: cysteine-rich CWC family protein [Sphingobacteriales bacterium]
MDFIMTKHEIIRCERCGKSMECKANAFTKCQCSKVQLNLNEVQYISENYEGCMCAGCLEELKEEYAAFVGIITTSVRKI